MLAFRRARPSSAPPPLITAGETDGPICRAARAARTPRSESVVAEQNRAHGFSTWDSAPRIAVPTVQRGSSVRGWGLKSWGRGQHGGARARRSWALSERLAGQGAVSLPVSRLRVFACSGRWALVSRGSVSLVFALVKGEGHSPAHEGIRRVGAPSTQRPCSSGQANIRAHPPVEPARDHQAHHTIIIITVQSHSVPVPSVGAHA